MEGSTQLRFFGRSRSIVRGRPGVLVLGALARMGLTDAVAVWPGDGTVTVALDLRDRTADSWAAGTLPPRARRLHLGARTWQLLRAREIARPRGTSLLATAVERVLGRPLDRPRFSLLSPGGGVSRLTLFAGEAGRHEPSAVVKVMARSEDGAWLEAEVGHRARLAETLPASIRAALLAPPLWSGRVEDEFVVVESVEPLLREDPPPPTREAAHEWLRGFHAATARGEAPWSEADTAGALDWVRGAREHVLPAGSEHAVARAAAALHALEGRMLPRGAAHGDFWPGNLAGGEDGIEIRVWDWEWLDFDRTPLLDLWSYELCGLNRAAEAGDPAALEAPLRAGVEAVAAELAHREIDPGFAAASLPAALSELIIRVRRRYGVAGPWERTGATLLTAAERLPVRSGVPEPSR